MSSLPKDQCIGEGKKLHTVFRLSKIIIHITPLSKIFSFFPLGCDYDKFIHFRVTIVNNLLTIYIDDMTLIFLVH